MNTASSTADRSFGAEGPGGSGDPGAGGLGLRRRAARVLFPLAVLNLVVNIGIVVTGGVVRLTGSGLGCPTWPRCTDESYVPHGSLGVHGAIEFGNRLLTFVVAAAALATFLAAWRAGHRRATRLSFVIGLGVPAQAVIGGITVLTDLNPWIVAFHLLCSLAMIGLCVLLLDVLRHPDDAAPGDPDARLARAGSRLGRNLGIAAFGVGWAVLYVGTIVTGSGPHAGDENAHRTGLDPELFSRLHAWIVYVLVALTVALIVVARREGHRPLLVTATGLLVIELAQGVVGYLQHFNGLPIGLVSVHMLGAALTSAALTWVLVRTRRPVVVQA